MYVYESLFERGGGASDRGINDEPEVGFALQANRLDIELSPIESVAWQRQPYLAVGPGLRGLVGPDLRIGPQWLVCRIQFPTAAGS